MTSGGPPDGKANWTFISNHGKVLMAIARRPDATLREMAAQVGITERAVQRIVADLEEATYLERVRQGRRNRYKVHHHLPLRHPLTRHQDVGALIELIVGATCGSASAEEETGTSAPTNVPAGTKTGSDGAGPGRARKKKPERRTASRWS